MLHDNKAVPDYVGEWYYLEYDWRGDLLVRGPFTVEYMRVLFDEGIIDGKTPVRYLHSQWHPLREVSAIFETPSCKPAPKWVRSGRSKSQELVVLGILAIIFELVLVYWTKPI
jgi:hypothetical protein